MTSEVKFDILHDINLNFHLDILYNINQNAKSQVISIHLKKIAAKQGISQREVWRRAQAHYPQLTWAALSHFANGHTTGVSYLLLEAICKALHCKPGDLLTIEEDAESEAKRPPQGAVSKN